MIITKIKRIGNTNRFHVYADQQWKGVFLDEILVKYQIKTDSQFEEEEFCEIKTENDQKVAFDMAVGYLEKYVVSEKGLKDYLKRKGFDEKIIQKTMEKLAEYNFVNDQNFAKNTFDVMSTRYGKRAIAQKLKQKGVDQQLIDELLENVQEEDEIENAIKIAIKFVKNRQNDQKIKQKCLAHLIYKGYDYSVAEKATRAALSENE